MSPQDNERMNSLIPNSKLIICENGSHCCMIDDPKPYYEGIHEFFHRLEK